MMYLIIPAGFMCAAWLIMKKRQLGSYITDCRDERYLAQFESETLTSDRGKVAEEMRQVNSGIAADRDYFINICYSSGVEPRLAAHAWIDRALSARFRHKPH
jgi:hypothetical protein